MPRILILYLAAASVHGQSQSLDEQLRALRPADSKRQEAAVLDNLDRRAREALAAIRHPRNRQEADKARPILRGRLEHSLGFRRFPWPPSLQARTVGAVRHDGYRIEKIVYETLPGVKVPAHLYVPDGLAGRAPAVLFYNGHWWADSKTRPDFQAFHINMARLGFVVMTFDAFGQGERGPSRRDHRRAPSLLAGVSQQGFAEYETQCAIEYLLSRKEVDPKRVGMTGASGGGYNTWMTAALDDRISVAVPVVGTSEFYEQIHVCRPHDWYSAGEHCHFVAGLIRYANNHELVAMVAPKPLMIIAASEDQSFPATGVREVAAYGKKLYEASGIPEKMAYSEDSTTGHGYQQKKREAAYGWFLKWLMARGDGSPYPEPPTEPSPWDSVELRCFPPGENQPAGPGFIAAVKKLADATQRNRSLPALDSVLGTPPSGPKPSPRIAKARLQRLEVPSETEISVPVFLLRPEGTERGVLVALDDRGKEQLAFDPVIREAVRKGWAVCGTDPRGIGELATTKPGWTASVSLLLGENFVGRQAFDLANVIEYLAASPDYARKPIGLYARGHNASLAAAYEAGKRSSRLRWFILRDGFVSFRHFLERPASMTASFKLLDDEKGRGGTYDREIPFQYFAFDVLRSFDIPELLAASRAAGLVINPIDGDWNRLSEEQTRKILPAKVRTAMGDAPDDAILRFIDGRK